MIDIDSEDLINFVNRTKVSNGIVNRSLRAFVVFFLEVD